MRYLLLILLLASPATTFVLPSPALAVEPSEMLADPVLEARARSLSKGLRCLVCQNENIDDSNAGLAADLRILLRERLTAGDTDAQAVQYIVDRYGEFVLLKPTFRTGNLLLWLAGPLLLAGGGFGAVFFIRARGRSKPESDLSDEEAKKIANLMSD